MFDKSLVRLIHSETRDGYTITALLSRFGDLSVFIWDEDNHELWQGDNVLRARAWLDTYIATRARIAAPTPGSWFLDARQDEARHHDPISAHYGF